MVLMAGEACDVRQLSLEVVVVVDVVTVVVGVP